MSLAASGSARPLRAPLALRVGVAGHRPDRLKFADTKHLGATIREILEAVKGATEGFDEAHRFYAPRDPGDAALRAISSLAEGSDRIFADEALGLGFALSCPTPFPLAEFKNDFAAGRAFEPDSERRFDDLLERALKTGGTLFELDGERPRSAAAYTAASRVVLNQSDILVVVWDGHDVGQPGGTEHTFAEARRRGAPVVWIDAHAPHPWQLVRLSTPYHLAAPGERASPSGGTRAALVELVRDLLDIPYPKASSSAVARSKYAHAKRRENRRGLDPAFRRRELVAALKRFYDESKRRVTLGPALWSLFGNFVGRFKPIGRSIVVPDFEEHVPVEWQELTVDPRTSIPKDNVDVVNDLRAKVRPYFVWPDALAVRYSQAYRSAFLAAYVLSALAVGAALLPVAGEWFPEVECIVAELVLIVSVLLLVSWGRHQHWHERWTDYRLAAELLRPLGVLGLLGGSRPLPQLPAHLATYGSPGATWMAWYVRAVERFVGLPTAKVDRDHLRVCLMALEGVLRAQLEYHENNEDQCDRMERHLHGFGLFLLVATLLGCGAHLFLVLAPSASLPPGLLVFVAGFLPALGASLAGISNQAEFVRMAKRSEAMTTQLETLLEDIDKVRDALEKGGDAHGPTIRRVVTQMAQTAELMVNEVLDWRVVLLDRPLAPPG